MNRRTIVAISGSTRAASSNLAILKTIASRYQNSLNVKIFNQIDELPHFNSDLEEEHLPEKIREFRAEIEGVEGIIFCTPEYVFSLPGSLKNALEWTVSSSTFSQKPVAIIVAAAAGEKTMESLTLILETIGAKVTDGAKLLIKGGRGKIGEDGLVNDKALLQNLDRLVAAFISSMEKEEAEDETEIKIKENNFMGNNNSEILDQLCMVSRQVLNQKKKVKLLYREEGLGELGIDIFDSGWRITSGEESQAYLDNDENLEFVPLREIVENDDSILELLSSPQGSEFEWNEEEGKFE